MKPVRTLVCLANEQDAKFLTNEGVGKGLIPLAGMELSAAKAEAIEYADKPGSERSSGGAHAAYQPRQSERDLKRAHFARGVVGALNQIWDDQSFDRIILAAPPRMLGELRGVLGALKPFVAAELDNDLLNTPERDLPGHFESVAAF